MSLPDAGKEDASLVGLSPLRVWLKHGILPLRQNYYGSEDYAARYIDLCHAMLKAGTLSPAQCLDELGDLLRYPQIDLQATFQRYSMTVTELDNAHYEERMRSVARHYEASLKVMRERIPFEEKLRDSNYSPEAYQEYINHEIARSRKQPEAIEEMLALFYRAIFKDATQPGFWLQMYEFLARTEISSESLLSCVELATRYCTANAELWACRIRTMVRAGRIVDHVMDVYTLAFSFGDSFGAQGRLKLISSTFLALRTLCESVGDTSGPLNFLLWVFSELNHVEDDQFLVGRLLISYGTATGALAEAKTTWKKLSKFHKDSADFWIQYMQWELLYTDCAAARNRIKSGCMQVTHDRERVYEAAMTLELQYGDLIEYEKTAAVIRKARQRFTKEDNSADLKRKLDSTEDDGHTAKRVNCAQDAPENLTPESLACRASDAVPKERSRETTSVIVRDLAESVTAEDLAEFFQDCGRLQSAEFYDIISTRLAVVEFEGELDMLAAQTRTLKELNGKTVTVESGEGSVLFVTNWPAACQADDLRELFGPYGCVLAVRMPSLMYNQQRRFAYVQMSSRGEAETALQLDGSTSLGDDHKISVVISNPKAKHARSSAATESREVFVKHISWKATEADMHRIFSPCGTITSLRLPQTLSPAHHDGICFIDFERADDAAEALSLDGTLVRGMALQVTLAQPRTRPRPARHVVVVTQKEHHGPLATTKPSAAEISAKTLGVMQLPDTMNEAQLTTKFEPFGALRKVELRPDHGGAVVEFENAVDAGRASLALSGTGDGQLHIGTYEDLMQQSSSQIMAKHRKNPTLLHHMAPRRVRTARKTTARLDLAKSAASPTAPAPTVTEKVVHADHATGQVEDTSKNQDYFRSLL